MLAISVNVLWLPLIVVVSFLFGMIVRKGQSVKAQRRILSLENEMLASHAEILRLQQEITQIEKEAASTSSTRVVTMKDAPSNADDTQKSAK